MILDGELVAIGDDGTPDFLELHRRRAQDQRLFAFDVLLLDGADVRAASLLERKRLLWRLISGCDQGCLKLVEAFDDGERLLAAAEDLQLEGIVSKRQGDPYRSGPSCGWVKVKTRAWRAANRERWRLFEKHR